MEHFDFDAPADVYTSLNHRSRHTRVLFRRFEHGADAIRHAVEGQTSQLLAGTVIEVDDLRFDASDIRSLYDSEEYPLPRHKVN